MTEFWACEACKSLVRGSADTCYRCRAPRPAGARELGIGAPGAVLTPGIDNGLQDVAFLVGKGRSAIPTLPLAALTIIGTAGVLLVSLVGLGTTVYLGYAVLNLRVDILRDPSFLNLVSSLDTVRSVLFLVSLALWLAFQGVSMYNAPLLGAGSPPTSIPAALAWWFVPILNVYVPARIVADLHARLASRGSRSQLMVGVWWASYVGSAFLVPVVMAIASISLVGMGIAGMIGARISLAPTFASMTIGTTALVVVGQLLYLLAGVAFMKVVADLHRRQEVRRHWVDEGRERFAASAGGAPAAPAGAPGGSPAGT